jgi:flagellar biosynthesis/type III secretory pathway protein FliH
MTTLDEIRARLAKANRFGPNWTKELHNHAPADLAFLLGEVERLQHEMTATKTRMWEIGKQADALEERAERAERERDTAVANAYEVGKRDGASAQRKRDAGVFRAIELTVDGLNTRAFQQKPETQAALDRIKAHCREAIRQQDKGEPG